MRRRELLLASLARGGGPWAVQRRGANCFNRRVGEGWLRAARGAGIGTVRLAYEKWGGQDFLLGSADSYRGLRAEHLKELIGTLDRFAAARLAVVVTPLTLPGARWRQMNGGRRDGRLWRDRQYWDMSAKFWGDMAGELRGHPAVVGLDVLNEPAPEVEWGRGGFWKGGAEEWASKMRGTAGDLNGFHEQMLGAIRARDSRVTVVVESGLYATPWALSAMAPLRDENVVYSIHMYEPYEYTTWRKHQGKLRYPGAVRVEETGASVAAGAAWLDAFFRPVRDWLRRHSIGADRMLVGEFGCGRRCAGAAEYLSDLLKIFEREQWHWLFYSFREDTWDGMDYELGAAAPPGWYWELAERGGLERRHEELYGPRRGNAIWQAIERGLSRGREGG